MLYHVSSTAGIKILEPRVSSHQKAYVYAIDNLVTALLFGARQDDFDFLIDEKGGKPIIYECYPNAFETVYTGKDCSVYEIAEAGFLRGVTSWEPELVCEHAVEVLREVKVTDLYERLLEEEKQGNLQINRYQDTMEYKKIISEHIVDRMIRFDALEHLETDARFQKYYKKIGEALLQIMDGSFL